MRTLVMIIGAAAAFIVTAVINEVGNYCDEVNPYNESRCPGSDSHAHNPSDGDQYGFMEYKRNAGISRTKVKTDSSSAGRYAILGTSGAKSAQESNLDFSNYTSFATPEISDSGVSGEGKNMPPYLTVYMWKRTA